MEPDQIGFKYVYKYRAIDENTKDCLRNKYFYFARPSQLNDPFDCRFRGYWDGSVDEKRAWMQRMRVDEAPLAKHFMTNRKIELSEFPDLRDQANEIIWVLSLASSPSSVPMWSHYANNHKGICIRLAVTHYGQHDGLRFFDSNFKMIRGSRPYPRGLRPLRKVEYMDDLPRPVNFLSTQDTDLLSFVFTKHTEWAYENEYRMTLPRAQVTHGEQKIRYGDGLVDGIIFGMNSDKDDELISILKASFGSSLSYFKAKKSEVKYEMEIAPL